MNDQPTRDWKSASLFELKQLSLSGGTSAIRVAARAELQRRRQAAEQAAQKTEAK